SYGDEGDKNYSSLESGHTLLIPVQTDDGPNEFPEHHYYLPVLPRTLNCITPVSSHFGIICHQ
ncbi:MAG: hypothetical protein PVJ08_07660, partial [Dehalococcoidia bacterium]